MEKKTKIQIWVSLLFFAIVSVNWLQRNGDLYNFGILVENHKDELLEIPDFYKINPNTNKYSWNSKLRLPDSEIVIRVEHLTPPVEFDEKVNSAVIPRKTLMSIVTCNSEDVEDIQIEVKLNGHDLECRGKYLYIQQGWEEREEFPLGWEVLPAELPHLKGEYGYVVIFNAKKGLCPWGHKWDYGNGVQKIKIKYIDNLGLERTHQYEFKLFWYLESTPMQRFMMIT